MTGTEKSVKHLPEEGRGTWVFDEAVASVFDDMLERSVPLYHQVHNLIKMLIADRCKNGGTILDLGVSTAASFTNIESLGLDLNCIGIDESDPMLKKAKANFPGGTYYNSHIQHFCNVPYYETHRLSLDGLRLQLDACICSLTLQFVPIEHRQFIVQKCYDHTVPNGLFFLFEKCLGDDAYLESFYTDTYYQFKEGGGYDEEKLLAKRKALENVLVPVTPAMNEDFLKSAGFRVAPLIQWCNFRFWVGVK